MDEKRFTLLHFINNCLTKALLLAVLLPLTYVAQDTILLKEVDVSTSKEKLSSLGKKIDFIDSARKQQFIFNSVGDLISQNTPVFIKNYGPGNISTSAFRGGNSSQTAVLWNGLNIQNNLLGQTDFSLLPSVLFDEISVEYGGSAALWGSGAVGGSVHLGNKAKFNRGLTSKVNLGGGSFGLFNTSAGVELSKKKFISVTRGYLQNSYNNYKYKDTLDKINPDKELKHAAYYFAGVMQEFKFMLFNKQLLNINAWYNAGKRQSAHFNPNDISKAEQKDENIRLSADWNYFGATLKSNVKSAWFQDVINYTDSAYSIFSKGIVSTFIGENENNFTWGNKHVFNFGANVTSYWGENTGYINKHQLIKAALLAGNKFSVFEDKLIIYIAARGEYISTGKIPLTGNLSLEYHPLKSVSAKINAAKVYRQPSLNELYWYPGGNPKLLPEEGYTCEGDLSYNGQRGPFRYSVSGSAFNRVIKNWILWLPANNFSTPVNIQEVWSRGTETSWKINYSPNKFGVSLNIITGYVLSTVNSSGQENGNTQNKQLIYTPRYTINSNLGIFYSGLSLTYYHQYVGYRFTSSDNLQWINPYHYSSVRLSLKSRINNETGFILFAACNNIFNTNYSIVSGRYMPLRNFEIGLSLINNKPNKKQI